MKTRLAALILLAALALGATAAAAEIEGVYNCKGSNPGGTGEYQGSVAIIKNGASYNVTWNIGAQTYVGVGLLDGDVLSVGYSDPKGGPAGIVVYKVKGTSLVGVWAMGGSAKTGTETLTKK